MSQRKRQALGRGLDALLPTVTTVKSHSGGTYAEKSVFSCPVELLHPQSGQPRQRIDETKLDELAASIREHGLIEPLVVRTVGTGKDEFEIVAGERRWRAAQRAGLKEVLVVVKDVSSEAAFELALIENLQREDLDPIEIAEALHRLIEEHGYTHETVARRIHKDRTTVTNALRLLKLPARVRTMVVEGRLTEGHARAILGANDPDTMEEIADRAVRGRLSVRKVESMVRDAKKATEPPEEPETPSRGEESADSSANIRDLEQRMTKHLGMRVQVSDRRGRGTVTIHYANLDELDDLLALLEIS